MVSDPGYKIVRRAIELGMNVIPIPGPSAFLLALIGSGLPCDRFVFEGFLPDKSSAAAKRLAQLVSERRTTVFYVAPHKLKKTLDLCAHAFGEHRPACIGREITKLHEQFLRGSMGELVEQLRDWEPRGECVLVVGGNDEKAPVTEEEEIVAAINEEIKNGKRMSEIASTVADRFGLKKSDVYKLALQQDDEFSEQL
ncbi:MAG: 16S rRNA (cytidine(1402)-2'-O)-methyltransferase [Terriglobales bacterium]